jgi:hypothetical protein
MQLYIVHTFFFFITAVAKSKAATSRRTPYWDSARVNGQPAPGRLSTIAVAKPAIARLPSVSDPKLRCSSNESPQDSTSAATRSLTGEVLSIPNLQGSPVALIASLV